MNCKVCDKSLKSHSTPDLYACLRSIGVDIPDGEVLTATGAFAVAARRGLDIGMSIRHKTITFGGKEITSSDMARDILQFCLVGEAVEEPRSKKRRGKEELPEEVAPVIEEQAPVEEQKEDEDTSQDRKRFW